MIRVQTKTEKPILNDRQKLIGNFIIYLHISNLEMNFEEVTALGNYYYKVQNGDIEEEINLKKVKTKLTWSMVSQIEAYVLGSINSETLKEAVLQRILEFTFLQLEQENGENWGTIVSDWEV